MSDYTTVDDPFSSALPQQLFPDLTTDNSLLDDVLPDLKELFVGWMMKAGIGYFPETVGELSSVNQLILSAEQKDTLLGELEPYYVRLLEVENMATTCEEDVTPMDISCLESQLQPQTTHIELLAHEENEDSPENLPNNNQGKPESEFGNQACPKPLKYKDFDCEICGKRFLRKWSATRHQREQHLGAGAAAESKSNGTPALPAAENCDTPEYVFDLPLTSIIAILD